MERNPKEPKMFVGREVENTPHKNWPTLFIAGSWPVRDIMQEARTQDVKHVYLAANQSHDALPLYIWAYQASALILQGFDVTMDIPAVRVLDWLSAWASHEVHHKSAALHLMVSFYAPGINKVNSSLTTFKFDDNVSDGSKVVNPGVWCMPAYQALLDTNFTPWSAYAEDKDI